MRFLRTNTAIRLTVGPFFDKTDGVTPETALTVTNCKLTLMVDDANVPTLVLDTNPTASGGANDMVHVTGDDAGFYDLELAAANVNYLGRAMLALTDAANHCPVFHEFMILPAMIYDSLVLGTDRLDTNVTHIGDTAQTARDIGASVLLSTGTGAGQLDFTSGVVKSQLADAVAHGGTLGSSTATLALSRMSVVSQSANTSAITTTGNGTGHGLIATSGAGATGDGIKAISGATNGYGIEAQGVGTGAGLRAVGGATGEGVLAQGGATSGTGIKATTQAGNSVGLECIGAGSGAAINGTGGATGQGMLLNGGATSGTGLSINGSAGNAYAVRASGNGSGAGVRFAGGATGSAFEIVGGGTSGDGISVTTTSGHGINLAPVGTDKHGFFSTGGNGGASDGMKLAAGTGGVDLRASQTGTFTGNLVGTVSTLTTYTGNTPQTGDAYAIVNSGTHGNAALKTLIDTIDDFIDTEVAAILEDTGTTLDDLVDDIEGRMTAALATALQAHSLGIGRGVVDAASTTTAVVFKTVNGGAASGTDDFYNGRHIVFTSGALLLQATSISDYTGASKTATVPAVTGAPAEDVTFIIV